MTEENGIPVTRLITFNLVEGRVEKTLSDLPAVENTVREGTCKTLPPPAMTTLGEILQELRNNWKLELR